MEATLETIPEETIAPTTNKNITFDVPKTKPATAKNPGRVASGKTLAERNRLAREAKKQADAQKPPTNSTTTNSINDTTDQSNSTTNNTSGYIYIYIATLFWFTLVPLPGSAFDVN